MPIVTPDDPARELPWMFMGFKGLRLPAAPVSSYGMFLALWGGPSSIAFVSVHTPRQWLIITAALLPVALILTKLVTRRLDTVRTVRYHRDLLAADVRTPRPPSDPGPEAGAHTLRLSPATFTRKDHP